MFESNLCDMTHGQLVATLSSLLCHHEDARWDVEDAELIFEVREELRRRGLSPRLLNGLLGRSVEFPLSKAAS